MVPLRGFSPRRLSTAEPFWAHQDAFSPLLPMHIAKSYFLAFFLIGWHRKMKYAKTGCGQKWGILLRNLIYKNHPHSLLQIFTLSILQYSKILKDAELWDGKNLYARAGAWSRVSSMTYTGLWYEHKKSLIVWSHWDFGTVSLELLSWAQGLFHPLTLFSRVHIFDFFFFLVIIILAIWRRAWQPTPVFLPRESHGQKSLAGYSP